MKVLVVDDEFYARKSLIQVIRQWDSSVTVVEAQNGEEAWGFIKADPPHLVLSDIRMPRVDGLTLARQMYQAFPSIMNVIVSGYDDFSYAQQAIQYKVSNYLLKPVGRDELVALLDRCKSMTNKNMESQQEEQLEESIFGETSASIETSSAITEVAVIRTIAGGLDSIKMILEANLSRHNWSVNCIKDRFHSDLIIAWMHGSSPLPNQVWHDIAADYNELNDGHLKLGISGGYLHPDEMKNAYGKAKTALLHRFIEGENVVYAYDVVLQTEDYDFDYINQMASHFYQKLFRYHREEALVLTRQVINGAPSVYGLYDICSKLTTTINAMIEWTNQRGASLTPINVPFDLHHYRDREHLISYLSDWVLMISHALNDSRVKMNVAEDLKMYVLQHYQNDIILEDLAHNIYFTDPSTLSRQFKKYSGVTFTQYLLSVRMNSAKLLLESGSSLNVSEVARMVGYNDYSHFIQTYKKHFGETPGRVRNNIK